LCNLYATGDNGVCVLQKSLLGFAVVLLGVAIGQAFFRLVLRLAEPFAGHVNDVLHSCFYITKMELKCR